MLFLTHSLYGFAQNPSHWEQSVDYKMNIDVDEKNFRYDGKMDLTYTNHSPDQLDKVYFHLYYNAFQPGSAMDYRILNIKDPDSRMVIKNSNIKEQPKSRIANLKENDIGFQKIKSIQQNGKSLTFSISGTIMEVNLSQPIESGKSTTLQIEWQAQVPEMIRRGGKNSPEGVDFSMTQWYPKMAHYDEYGWHLDEYVGREFVAPFGNFDVQIQIQKDYVIGASGKLQNPTEVKGYDKNAKIIAKNGKANWHFVAKNIHDFAWAADREYIVSKQQVPNGPEVFFVHLNQDDINANWEKAKQPTVEFFQFMEGYFGAYPWETYSVIQGGDGGMEYGTATLVTGGRDFDGLVGVIFHEAAHSWFQQLFGINETLNEWMDEGFTSYAEELARLKVFNIKTEPNPNLNAYDAYYQLVNSGLEEPMSLLADYYNYNYSYSIEAYIKGQVYLIQLGYIIGEDNLKKTFKEFYKNWKFKHPYPNDFKRTAEKVSGLNLKWYQNLIVNTTRTVNYAISKVSSSQIELKNLSNFPMPIDFLVEYKDGTKELFYIPNLELRGIKSEENLEIYQGAKRTVLEPWAWTNPTYKVSVSKEVKKATIDPTLRLADIDLTDNSFPKN